MTDYLTAEALGAHVRETMQVRDITQEEMAERVERKQTHVSRALAGEYMTLLVEMAQVLGLDVERDDQGRGVRYYRLSG